MSRVETAEAHARRALANGAEPEAEFAEDGLAVLAVDRTDGVAAVLLAAQAADKSTVRAWVFVFESPDSGWEHVFDHNDAWSNEPFDRPSGEPVIHLTTSVRGDALASGDPILSFAGVATTEATNAVLETSAGSRPVAIEPATGAFVLVAFGQAIELTLRNDQGEVVDRLDYSAPPQ